MSSHAANVEAESVDEGLHEELCQLVADAESLPAVPTASVDAYEQATGDMVATVDEVVLSNPRIDQLRGTLALGRLHDNHAHHAAFMAVVFRYGTYRLLARILPWVYRSYHQHGVGFAYFPLELRAWQGAVRAQLDEGQTAEILEIYDWMLAVHDRVQRLCPLPSPFEPAPSDSQWQGMRARLTELLLAGDWRQSQILVRASGTPSQRADFFEKALRDSLYEVGSQWETGTISVAREHLATATVARLLAAMPVVSDAAVTPKGKAIVTATANEHHQVGAWLIADALEADGWDVRFLGANTPEQELLALLREECPDLLLLSATLPFNLRHVQDTIQAARCLPECHNTRILVGGQAFAGEPDLDRRLGADGTGKDCRDAVAQAALWWGERTGGQ